MDALSNFQHVISQISTGEENLTIEQAREVVRQLNEFLYCTNPNETEQARALGSVWNYLSDFHKYWEQHHQQILDCKIDDEKCEQVADALHGVYVLTKGKAYTNIYPTAGLTKEQICQVRLLTANQDFRGSRNFIELAEIFYDDPSIFDVQSIADDPSAFVRSLKISNLSQTDKRDTYAKNIAEFVLSHNCSPYELISKYNNNVFDFRNALIAYNGAGYGNKKADMLVRDMVVLKVWKNITGFENIDVASDVNTIKVALRTGIIKTEIPLVSSFLDIFCHQYSYMDAMNAKAWRRVWEIWCKKYPQAESLNSPCLIDYFVYGVIGKQFCKNSLAIYKGIACGHRFPWHSARNKICQVCFQQGLGRRDAMLIDSIMPCSSEDGKVAIRQTDYVRSLSEEEKMEQCPFKDICGENRKLMPPKSISIMGQTGWTTAYAERGLGGGGLMA